MCVWCNEFQKLAQRFKVLGLMHSGMITEAEHLAPDQIWGSSPGGWNGNDVAPNSRGSRTTCWLMRFPREPLGPGESPSWTQLNPPIYLFNVIFQSKLQWGLIHFHILLTDYPSYQNKIPEQPLKTLPFQIADWLWLVVCTRISRKQQFIGTPAYFGTKFELFLATLSIGSYKLCFLCCCLILQKD